MSTVPSKKLDLKQKISNKKGSNADFFRNTSNFDIK